MRKFPSHLKPENKKIFSEAVYRRNKCYMRRDIYEHIISKPEDFYFSLDDFNRKINNIELTQKMAKEIAVELENLGWKCKFSFGDTALFIYSTENPPVNCYDNETLS